jgi:hypothetical protein
MRERQDTRLQLCTRWEDYRATHRHALDRSNLTWLEQLPKLESEKLTSIVSA